MRTLKVAKKLQQGSVIAHQTSTLPGVAASAASVKGIKKVQRFKQRKAPFLLLADSMSTALKQAVYISPALRKLAQTSWPGAVTLVFPAVQTLDKACYQGGCIAIRVDADIETQRLAKACGGLLLSSSLNRKGQAVQQPHRKQRYRWQRHLSAVLPSVGESQGRASKIYKIRGKHVIRLR